MPFRCVISRGGRRQLRCLFSLSRLLILRPRRQFAYESLINEVSSPLMCLMGESCAPYFGSSNRVSPLENGTVEMRKQIRFSLQG